MYGPPGKIQDYTHCNGAEVKRREREDDQHEGNHERVRRKGLRPSLREVLQELEGRRRVYGRRLLEGAGNGPMCPHSRGPRLAHQRQQSFILLESAGWARRQRWAAPHRLYEPFRQAGPGFEWQAEQVRS